MFEMVKIGDPDCELKYNKFYVGLIKDARANNYVAFRPKKSFELVVPKLPRTDELDALLDDANTETLEYAARWGNYRIRVADAEFKKHSELFRRLNEEARERQDGWLYLKTYSRPVSK